MWPCINACAARYTLIKLSVDMSSLRTCSEVVPEQLRSTVYAFDRSFEGAVGATAAPLVGALYPLLLASA